MDELYIPGFTNFLYSSEPDYGVADYGMGNYTPLVYNEPVYNPSIYNEPVYNPPMYNEPMYSEPVYNPPMYNEPMFSEPVYSEPVYNPPLYSEPVYNPPMYNEPMYSEPAYTPPVEYTPPVDYVMPPQYSEPVYSEPAYTSAAEYLSPMDYGVSNYVAPAEYAMPSTSAPSVYNEPLGSLYASGPVYGEQAPNSAEPTYNPYVEPAYTEQVGTPYAAEPVPSAPAEQAGSPYAVEPVPSAPVQQPYAVEPAPLSYEEREARRIAANTPPSGTFLTAPTNNLGRNTGFDIAGQGSNLLEYRGGPIRVTDRNGKVLFSGEGPEAAAEAVRFAQNLSDTQGANAAWDIQQGERTINPDGSVGEMRWISGPSDRKDGRGIIGDLGAFVIPAMVALATGGLSIPAQIAAGAAAGAAGNAFAARDPLEGAIVGGLTAGGGALGSSQLAPALNVTTRTGAAIGTGLGATAGGLATGQSLQNALLSGLASGAGSYFIPGVAEELGITTPGAAPSSGSSGSFDGSAITVNAPAPTISPPVSFGGGSGSNLAGDAKADTLGGDEIVITGGNAPPSINLAPIFTPSPQPVPVPQPLDAATPQQPAAPEESPIVVTGGQPNVSLPVGLPAAPPPPSPLDAGAPQQPAQPEAAPENRDIVVTGGSATPSINLAPIFTPSPQPVPIPQPLETGAVQQPTNPDEIVVTGGEPLPPSVPVTLPIPSGGLPPVDYEAGIDVTATRPTVPEQPTSIPVTPPITPSRIDLGFTGARDGATAPEEGGTTLKDIADYLRLAGLASSLLGGLAGSGGGGGGQRFNIPSTMGKLSPVFGGSLPTANLPGLGGGSAGATRPPSEMAGQGLSSPIDYYRYGYGPQQSFFNYVPQGAPNTSQAYTGYAKGGYAVEGAGDGRDDKIPALLSDGEYVIDAETVALLGNGSNKAGAQMLDKFRVNVRKQKGRKLARGEFSENAKRPEHYMAGGLS